MKYEIVICKPMIHIARYEMEATDAHYALNTFWTDMTSTEKHLTPTSESMEDKFHDHPHDLDEVHIIPIFYSQSTPPPNQSKDAPLGFVTASTLCYDEVKIGQKVQFYDKQLLEWIGAEVFSITHGYGLNEITLRTAGANDIILSAQDWYASVRDMPT